MQIKMTTEQFRDQLKKERISTLLVHLALELGFTNGETDSYSFLVELLDACDGALEEADQETDLGSDCYLLAARILQERFGDRKVKDLTE